MSGRTLGIIPARGGSKRIPQKNIKEVAGRPLITHTIDHAAAATNIDKTIVSTEDEEIAEIAREHGGDVPFMRPEQLARDDTPTEEVIAHALEQASEHYGKFEHICLLQVTSPLREPIDIDKAIEQLSNASIADSVVSISPYITPPQWAIHEGEDGYLEEYFDFGTMWTDAYVRTQEVPELTHPNGAVYVATTEAWEKYESFFTPRTVGYEMPPERSFDIDEPWELDLVQALMSEKKSADCEGQ